MSLFKDYIEEREKGCVLEREDGFAIYFVLDDAIGKVVYIREIFVPIQFRRNGVATLMADEISTFAREIGAHSLMGSIDPRAPGASGSMQALLHYGFKLDRLDGALIMLKKNLGA